MIDCCIQKTEKKQSLIRLFSNWDKKTRKNSHWSDCYLLSILRNLVGKFEIHMILLSLYSIYLSTSLHLSEVSGIFDLLPTWAFPSENVTWFGIYKRKKTAKIIVLHAWAVGWVVSDYSHYEKTNTQSQWWTNQYTFSMLFSRADLRESIVFYDFFSRPMFTQMFSLLVYLQGQCSSLKQEHLSYLFIDSL